MRKILLLLLIICCTNIYAQDTNSYQPVKTSQEGGRYEIIQVEFPELITLKLDKHKGEVRILSTNKYGKYEWGYPLIDIFNSSCDSPNKINYQLYWGGTKSKDCFLLNINSGEIFELKNESSFFNNYHAFRKSE